MRAALAGTWHQLPHLKCCAMAFCMACRRSSGIESIISNRRCRLSRRRRMEKDGYGRMSQNGCRKGKEKACVKKVF